MNKKLISLIIALSGFFIATAIITDNGHAGVEPSPFKEIFSMQDINPIKRNIIAAQRKLSQADRVKQTNLVPNIQSIQHHLTSFSSKVERTKKAFGKNNDLRKLSNGIRKGLDIVNGMDQQLTAKNKPDFINRLTDLSDVVLEMEKVIQSL